MDPPKKKLCKNLSEFDENSRDNYEALPGPSLARDIIRKTPVCRFEVFQKSNKTTKENLFLKLCQFQNDTKISETKITKSHEPQKFGDFSPSEKNLDSEEYPKESIKNSELQSENEIENFFSKENDPSCHELFVEDEFKGFFSAKGQKIPISKEALGKEYKI